MHAAQTRRFFNWSQGAFVPEDNRISVPVDPPARRTSRPTAAAVPHQTYQLRKLAMRLLDARFPAVVLGPELRCQLREKSSHVMDGLELDRVHSMHLQDQLWVALLSRR